jgi:hypothetical protein
MRGRESLAKKKSARELRQGGSDYRCCIPALAGFVSPQSIAPDGDKLFAKDRPGAIEFCSTVKSALVGRDSVEPRKLKTRVTGCGDGSTESRPTKAASRDQANGMFDLMRYVSVLSTSADLAMCRLRLPLFEDSKCRREACCRMTLPVPVILNRFETAFRVLLRAIAFGIRRGR